MSYDSLFKVGPSNGAKGENGVNYGPTYRVKYAKDGVEPIEGVQTCYDLFERSVSKHGDRPCLGYRPKQDDGKVGPYKYYTYKETQDLVAKVASAMVKLGVEAGNRVGIFGVNSPQWMIAMQACNRQSFICVPLYDTLGEDAIEYEIDHAEVKLVLVAGDRLHTFDESLPKMGQQLKALVYWGQANQEDVKRAGEHVSVHSWEEALSLGAATPAGPVPPTPASVSTIMYTSGTTGQPKGVVLTHEALVATIASLRQFVRQEELDLNETDRIMSYLPLAHIFDRMAEETFLSLGAGIGYWQGNIKTLMEDLEALKPTLLIGVPRVFDRIRSGTLDKVNHGSAVARFLFNRAYNGKYAKLKRGAKHNCSPFYDTLVFKKIKAKVGGEIKAIISGGAPLSREVEEFLRVTMCAPVVQGYGLSETCGASCIGSLDNWGMVGTVGVPLSVTDFRLEAVPEMNYSPFADPPRGELCIKGHGVFKEYYKQPDKTAEEFDAEGFFHTGDVAELAPSGAIRIIDRKKNIFKLAQGEYVAVEKVEAAYKLCDVVNQIWVYGNSFEQFLVAFVVPNPLKLTAFAKSKGIDKGFEELCGEPACRQWVLEQLTAQGKQQKLKGFEIIKAVELVANEWTVEQDLLTPSYKLKRPQMQKKYQASIDQMYKDLKAKAK